MAPHLQWGEGPLEIEETQQDLAVLLSDLEGALPRLHGMRGEQEEPWRVMSQLQKRQARVLPCRTFSGLMETERLGTASFSSFSSF